MKYIVIELQKNAEGVLTTPVNTYNTLAEAENKYYTILAYAAVSKVPVHSASILTEEGSPVMNKYYKHEAPAPEPVEPEPSEE